MGTFGTGKASLSSQTDEDKRAYLDERCAHLHIKRGAAITLIFDYWLAMGAPPLTPSDPGSSLYPIPKGAQVELPEHWLPDAGKDAAAIQAHLKKKLRGTGNGEPVKAKR